MNNKNKSLFMITLAIVSIFLLFLMNKPTSSKDWQVVNKYVKPKVIVFIGDSITEGANFKDAFENTIVLNKGICGDDTYDIIDRLRDDVYDFMPDKVFLLIGINDIGKDMDNEQIIENIDKIISDLKDNCPNTEIYLQSIYPVNNTNDKKIDKKYFKYQNNKDVIAINKKIKDIADDKNITYIDIYSHLLDENDNLKLSYTKEGLHLNEEGYEAVYKILEDYIYKK